MDVDLATERHTLDRALAAVEAKLQRLAGISGGGADALADEYIANVVRTAVRTDSSTVSSSSVESTTNARGRRRALWH